MIIFSVRLSGGDVYGWSLKPNDESGIKLEVDKVQVSSLLLMLLMPFW
jgi:hypothetical protein